MVEVAAVNRRDVALFSESLAELDGYVDAEIRARVRGFLKTQHYKDGSSVKAGQLLFSIDPSEYANALAAAKAGVARARAAESGHRVLLERNRSMYQSGAVSQQALDDARTNLADSAGQLAAAEALLEQAKLNLSYTQIRSPIDGVAGLAAIRVGNLVGQDGPSLLTTVSQIDPIRVTFALSEVAYLTYPERFSSLDARDLAWARRQFEALVKTGLAEHDDPGIELLLSDGSVYAHRGLIITADRQIDASTGTLRIQALIPNPEGRLRPGQYGRVRMARQGEGHDVITVPEKALISVQGSYSVGVVDPHGRVELRRVILGASVEGRRVVLSGLQEGDQIVIEGVQRISDGAQVTPRLVTDDATSTAHPTTAAAKN
jgi:membrane fusion protein, multidrug efflux system